jgi:asparagine synthase (glutamine-hydrolysing)
MPGIVGIISRKPAAECARAVPAMLATMRHENFHQTGTFSAPELGVFTGWVVAENTFASRQVFQNQEKSLALVFAGECFLDPATKNKLRQNGHPFSATGGDWLMPLYEELGEKFFLELNGQFSGLLIDQRQQKVFLFNDRYGVERIYWHETTEAFYFASEAKALLRIVPELRAFDREGVAQFLAFGSTLEGRTLFQDVSLLPGGSLWTFANGQCERKKYFSPAQWEQQPAPSEKEFAGRFEATLKKILPRYFESESKIGLSLTAGLDMRMIMACRPASALTPVCYTFDEAKRTTLDARIAAKVAATCGLDHHIIRMGADFFKNFARHAERTIYISDGYFGVTGAHEIYLNQLARAFAPVRLGGAFGGEILREVSTFKPCLPSGQLTNPEFQQSLDGYTRHFAAVTHHPVTFAAFKEIPWNIFGSPAICRSQLNFRTPYLDNEIVALAYQIPANLRKSSYLPMEVVRNNDAALSRIPTDMGYAGDANGVTIAARRLFCKATFKLDYLYNEGMPSALSPFDPMFNWCASSLGVLGLHKYLHYRRWFRGELADYINDATATCRRQDSEFWNADFLAQMVRDHISGRGNYVREINAVLTLGTVQRLLFREMPNN